MDLRETWMFGRGLVRVLADSSRTDEIHLAEELTGRDYYRRYIDAHRASPALDELLRLRPELRSDQVDYDQLRRLPAATLGGAYVRHLDDHGITADAQAVPTRFVDDDEVAYMMRRYRQVHDVWHVLLGLGIQGHEEVMVHAFSWGQLRLPVSALVLVFGTVKHIVLERRWRTLRHTLRSAYQVGRSAAPLLPAHWETMWEQPLEEIRSSYRVRPPG